MSHISSTNLPNTKRAYRIREAAALYGLSRSAMMAEGNLRTVKIGGRRLIPSHTLKTLLRENSE